MNNNYVNDSAMLPRGDTYSRGRVTGRKIDVDGNVVGRRKDNPILDTRKYCVEFDDGEVIELTSNVISESMYAVYDDSGDEYLIMDLIVDYPNNDKAVTVPD